ncbi:prolipoprotein diacylglyceryl transferase [Candidatus Woesearchaeota archaeon]|nr:prolipoprotein diacylglyceryl transferase [Nanoarchaeota archaeon]MCB9370719.1 prolipoprotein diacylglyceryl transferase [Candidatus Woesearchaeota archaeon]USN43795.1 MAG: prolipoprotein diacylglyceryl transferase [Candidatus Woesearchaeota archaeon]
MISPIAISIGPLAIHWYALAYVLAFLFGYIYITKIQTTSKLSKETLEDIFLYFMVFSVLGGRLFYILLYNPLFYLANPLEIIRVDKGGMSIHGGIFFGFLVLRHFEKKYRLLSFSLTDLFCVPAALGLSFGRLANFVNQELVGTPTKSIFGVVFPLYDTQLRHPVTLYASLKNMLLFQILLYLQWFEKLKTGMLTVLFLILYNIPRFFIDFLREPTVSLGILSLGQFLCLLYTAFAFYLFYNIKKKPAKKEKKNT